MKTSPATPKIPACDNCGRAEAVQIDDRWLCVDCYAEAGACCAPESGNGCEKSPADS